MARYACPICGDPSAYRIWLGDPPEGCPYDKSWMRDGPVVIKSVTECSYQMGKARQQAEWRKNFPDQFDEAGKIKPGGLDYILDRLPRDTVLIF